MTQKAKLFTIGHNQAIQLPDEFRFAATEVFISRDPETGDVILSERPPTWDGFFAALANTDVPDDFLDEHERRQAAQERDPFAGWRE
jgi:antitoxin VapB